MWIPNDASEIERAALAGELEETPSFDAKADLPPQKKNATVATDVAAMATDGGVLLYGVAEDEDGRPTIPNPITLKGAADRIGQIVSTSIAEVPYIKAREYQCSDDPARGYLLVIVPLSERAPHQVTVGGDLRFYGRGPKGNRILTEGDVARLYQRRHAWMMNREEVLADVVASAPIAHREGHGYLHAFTHPVAGDAELLERAFANLGGLSGIHQRLMKAVYETELEGTYSPNLERAPYFERHSADEWRFATEDVSNIDNHDEMVEHTVVVGLSIEGRGTLFCGRAAGSLRHGAPPSVLENVIAGNLEAFLSIMGTLYAAAGYHGPVAAGVGITGLTGARSERRGQGYGPSRFTHTKDSFMNTTQVAAAELDAPTVVAQTLVRRFYETTTGIEGYNPFRKNG